MKILGVCNDETSSACLMVDGEIVSAASEERFSRIKMDNSFPVESIRFCLESNGFNLKDIDVVAYAWSKGLQPELLGQYVDRGFALAEDGYAKEIFSDRIKWELIKNQQKRSEFNQWVAEKIDIKTTMIKDYYHHEAHAASAAYFSGFSDGLVFTADGRGDFESATLWKFERNAKQSLVKLYSASSVDSLGFFYGVITGLLGFKPMRHEGKVTGLAAYGNPQIAIELCKKMVNVSNGVIQSNLGDYYRPFFQPYSNVLQEEALSFRGEDLAAAAQFHLEKMMCDLVEYYLKEFESDHVNIMAAGGVFGNVKVTQKIKELPKVRLMYVQPQMGDGGLCLGAAALANEELIDSALGDAQKVTKRMNSVYLGPSPNYDSASTPSFLTSEKKFEVVDIKSAPKLVAETIFAGNVVGLIQGRMEFGPRALCNRSIIYKTSDKSVNDWLNKRMNRTEFMPFAPVIRKERALEAIQDYDKLDSTLSFMTSTVNCTEQFSKACPATVHIDGTARPQIVTAESNHFIWSILSEWETLSGELALINTSFNAHEEPIVLSESDGVNALNNNVIDELWVVDDDLIVRRYKNK